MFTRFLIILALCGLYTGVGAFFGWVASLAGLTSVPAATALGAFLVFSVSAAIALVDQDD